MRRGKAKKERGRERGGEKIERRRRECVSVREGRMTERDPSISHFFSASL